MVKIHCSMYDHEEIVEDVDVDIDEREEETIEAVAREVGTTWWRNGGVGTL